MNRQEFLTYLTDNGCVIVRTDKQGYSVIRNVMTGNISGVPLNDPCYAATVCRICKTLGVEPPECALAAVDVVEKAQKKHGNN